MNLLKKKKNEEFVMFLFFSWTEDPTQHVVLVGTVHKGGRPKAMSTIIKQHKKLYDHATVHYIFIKENSVINHLNLMMEGTFFALPLKLNFIFLSKILTNKYEL